MAQFKRSAVENALTALGFKGVSKYPDERFQRTVDTLAEHVDDDTWPKLDKGQTNLVKAILKATKAEDDITILDDSAEVDVDQDAGAEVAAAPPKKGAAKTPPPKAAKAGAPAKGKAPPKKAGGESNKGPGVIGSIVEFLESANSKKPLSKQALVEKLCKRFPDRPSEGMAKTVNVQVPTRIRTDKGINVQKNENGYWIAS